MKYIDAELLKAKLDEHYRNYQSKYMETRNPYTQGLIDALDLAEQVIGSLQQEQQEEPDKVLEEEMERFFEEMSVHEHENIFDDTFQMIARYFYELGKNSK